MQVFFTTLETHTIAQEQEERPWLPFLQQNV